MRAYSRDLRERILGAVDGGMPISVAVMTFSVGRSTVKRYIARRRETGDIAPKQIPGRPPTIGPSEYPALIAQLSASPDATLEEHCAAWESSHGVHPSIWAMESAIQRVNWTRKKRRFRLKRETL